MHRVLLLGAGKIGRMIARLLVDSGDYDVVVGDVSPQRSSGSPAASAWTTVPVDVESPAQLAAALAGCDTVISALSFYHNPRVAEAALAAGVSYFDLTEDVDTTRRVREIAEQAADGQIFMPQCGLAPGFISIVAKHLTQQLRQARHGAHARRRPAAVSHRRAEVQPHLVDRRADQRVLQPVRRDPRRPADRGVAARRLRAVLARRRAVRGVQHQRRPRHAVRDARGHGARAELQDGPLHRATAIRCSCW